MRFQALQKPLGPAEGRLIPLIGLMYYAFPEGRLIPLIGLMYYAFLALGGPLASQSRA